MKDQFGRTIDYMRISITDRCNLRCRYCMPERIEWLPKEELFSLEEIAEICRLASSLGIRKIKITGGEPLVRNGCDRLIGMISQIPGIDQVSLTTNGILLADYAESLRRQGLHAVNVSLDALDPDIYAQIRPRDWSSDVCSSDLTSFHKYWTGFMPWSSNRFQPRSMSFSNEVSMRLNALLWQSWPDTMLLMSVLSS